LTKGSVGAIIIAKAPCPARLRTPHPDLANAEKRSEKKERKRTWKTNSSSRTTHPHSACRLLPSSRRRRRRGETLVIARAAAVSTRSERGSSPLLQRPRAQIRERRAAGSAASRGRSRSTRSSALALARSGGVPAGSCPDPVLVPWLSQFGAIWGMFSVNLFAGVFISYAFLGASFLIQLVD
jgi:hypothetical protein